MISVNYPFKEIIEEKNKHFDDFMITMSIPSNPTPNQCPNKTNRHPHTHRKSTVVFYRMSRTNKLF